MSDILRDDSGHFLFLKGQLDSETVTHTGYVIYPKQGKNRLCTTSPEGEIFPGGDLGLIVDWNVDKTYKITTPPKNRCPTTALPNLLSQYGPALFRGKKLHFS